MELAEAKIIQQGNNYHVQHGTDAGLYVEFYVEAIEDQEESVKEGRPIFRDVEMTSIRILGDNKTHVVRPVDLKGSQTVPPDNVRWPHQWAAFKNKQIVPQVGTPITEWGPISKSQAMSLKILNIHTVESLAQVSDTNLGNIGMGARDLRDKAIAYLNQAKDGSGLVKLQEENKDLRTKIEALQNQMSALLVDKPKRGRPPKGVDDAEDAS
jgi:hypothetical protein